MDARVLAAAQELLEQDAELLAVSSAQLDEGEPPGQRGHDLGGARLEQLAFGTRDLVPGQAADRLEQTRAERVVEVFRLDLARPHGKIAAHLLGEERALVENQSLGGGGGQGFSSSPRGT